MSFLTYDLHVHSCLSPCGDDTSTPAAIAGMAKLNGLDVVALTDHNTAQNCPAFFRAARHYGVIPVAGMELTTAEDIHVVCLFRSLEGALAFDSALEEFRAAVPNRPDIFGNQRIVDEEDQLVREIDNLLINALDLSIEQVVETVVPYGGAAFPAHVEKESNGILAILGAFPLSCGFTAAEVSEKGKIPLVQQRCGLSENRFLVSSDAHVLWNLKEGGTPLPFEIRNPERAADELVDWLQRSEK